MTDEAAKKEAFQMKLSRKMQKIGIRTQALISKEMGEEMGFAIIIWPWAEQQSGFTDNEKVSFQYVSSAPRSFMFGCLETLLNKWKSNEPDIPPHLRQ